jgi:hypothetical protein
MSTYNKLKTWTKNYLSFQSLNREVDGIFTALNDLDTNKLNTAGLGAAITALGAIPIAATTISASGQITSTVADGTSPLVVTSTTEVANLKAAAATLAANSSLLEGKHWVEVVNSSVSISGGANAQISLRVNSGHNLYMYSVYCNATGITIAQGTTSPLEAGLAYIHKAEWGGTDVLFILNEDLTSRTFYYQVLAWE